MIQHLTLGHMAMKMEQEEQELESVSQAEGSVKSASAQNQSDSIPAENEYPASDASTDDVLRGESRDIVDDAMLPTLPRPLHALASERRQSCSTFEDSPPPSGSSSPTPSPASSATSCSIYTVDSFTGYNAINGRRRPSVLGWLKSSVNLSSTSTQAGRRPIVKPADFQICPEQPEKHFVDTVGMILPGVCDRNQCTHPLAHFVSIFRLCEPIEYTTTLADHGITYTDYCRLVTALLNFLEEISNTSKRRKSKEEQAPAPNPRVDKDVETCFLTRRENTFFDTTEQLKKSNQQAAALNKLLEDITLNLQTRGVPVMVCVNSFSVFAPYRISEAYIQILHVTPDQMLQGTAALQAPSQSASTDARIGQRLSFIKSTPLPTSDQRPKLKSQAVSAPIITTTCTTGSIPHQRSHSRDHSRPCPLWPNAIPSRKRQIMSANVDRYGVDPYFRAWMRANINSRTQSSTYAKYMIEQEDNPFVNRRLQYTDSASRSLLLDVLVNGSQAWKEQFPCTVNRARYQHNRRLECRKIIEQGSRLRIVRFGFRYPIYPPHTPEMEALGLTKNAYETTTSDLNKIHTTVHLDTRCPLSYLLASLNKIRQRSTDDALMKVNEYIRKLNAQQRRIVWTIEKIPGVYDRGLARDRTEWEISAWNGEDPLELLLQLEKWGLVEKRLSLEDED